MKKTQWIELFYNIRHTLVSFIAVILFVALATGLFTGIKWTGRSLSSSLEDEYSRGCLHHFEMSYPYGFDVSFIDSLTENGIADEAEGYYETYRGFQFEGRRYHAKIVSLTEKIDRPYCLEGALPTREGEAAVNYYWAGTKGISVGDVITVEKSETNSGFVINAVLEGNTNDLLASSDKSSELVTDTFRVTALVGTAEYIGKYSDTNGTSPVSPAPVETVIYVAEQSFDGNAFCGYPKVVISEESLNGLMTGSEEYGELSDRMMTAVDQAAQSYASQKNADIRASAERMTKMLSGTMPENGTEGGAAHFCGIFAALESIRDYEVYTASRRMNASYAGIRSVMDTFDKMQYSLVILFVIIGTLVCYSTITRLVHDQTVMIGTKKAIGFFASDIIKPFLIYSAITVVLGTVFGALLGRFLIEPVTVDSVRSTYRFGRTIYYYSIRDVLIFAAIYAALILATAFIASVSVSRQQPLTLLTGESETSGSKHAWLDRMPFWNRTSLLTKTIVRNCLNDRRRVFATLIGVLGCTALVVCSLSMYNNLVGSFDLTMSETVQYDTAVYFSGEDETKEKLCAFFDEKGVKYADSSFSLGAMHVSSGEQLVTGLFVTDNDDFYDLFHLPDANGDDEKIPEHGAWINIAYADKFGASVGDTLSFIDASGQIHEFPIEGFYTFYLLNYQIIIPKALYEEEYGVPYEANTFILRRDTLGIDEIRSAVLDFENGLVVKDTYGGTKGLFDSIAVIARAVAAVYLVLSCALAVLLLLNLFTMFVSEKKRELITLMVNGFSRKDAEKYICVDTRILTVIGVAAGIVLGVIMGGVSLNSFNNSATYFLNRLDVTACVIGVVFTAVLAHIMCRIALRKVRSFGLSDINTM